MFIKEISPNGKDFFIRDLKKEFSEYYHLIFENYDKYIKWQIEHFSINKKAGLLDYEILNKKEI